MTSQVLTDGNDDAGATQFDVYALDGNDYVYVTGNIANTYNIYGGEGSDFIQMDNDFANGYFYGGGANDVLSGGQRSDHLYGNDGDDLLSGGELDNSQFSIGVIALFNGEPTGDDFLTGDDGTDALYGFDGADTLYGGDGDESGTLVVYDASRGAHTIAAGLYGGAGKDYLDGGAGNDLLDGGTDADRMIGGDGNDRFYVDNAADVVVEAVGGGSDYVLTSVTYALKAGVEVERLLTTNTNGSTAINLVGNEFGQQIYGNQAANKITALGGNDVLYGYGGGDALYGGEGKDTLTGGLGNDSFMFDTKLDASTNVDTISDFHNVTGDNDTIRLENAIFTKLAATGALAAGFFAANATGTAADGNDYIVYNTTTGALFYDADGNDAGKAVQFATLTGHPTLTAADFVVV